MPQEQGRASAGPGERNDELFCNEAAIKLRYTIPADQREPMWTKLTRTDDAETRDGRSGLLDSTLVWGGEFGRSPDNNANARDGAYGRDHKAKAMNLVLAGGGVSGGRYVGATDELGEKAVDCVHPVRDFHDTLLHLLGLNDNKLTFFHGGRHKQLSQVGGEFIRELIA